MTPIERAKLHEAIKKTTELFKQKTSARDWSINIIEGSKPLQNATGNTWKHYYVWLANPDGYNEEATDALEIEKTKSIESYDPCMRVETFQNGTETIVRVINKNLEDDEKVPS